MLLKVPSVDWTDQIVYVVDDDESLSDFDDEPDFSEYMWMENEEEFDKNVRSILPITIARKCSISLFVSFSIRSCNDLKRKKLCKSALKL